MRRWQSDHRLRARVYATALTALLLAIIAVVAISPLVAEILRWVLLAILAVAFVVVLWIVIYLPISCFVADRCASCGRNDAASDR